MQVNDIHNDIESVLITAEELKQRTAEIGAQISADFAGRNPLFVGVLKGCFVFMADLMRSVTIHCSMDFMAVSSYGNATKTTGAVEIIKDLNQDIEGRDIILVEDILDSGITLNYLRSWTSPRAARRLCTPGMRASRCRTPSWSGTDSTMPRPIATCRMSASSRAKFTNNQ